MVQCARCKGNVEPTKAQLVGKCAGSWRCNQCNTRGTQLYGLPEWKGFSSKLRDFSKEQQAEFWAASHEADNKQKLSELVEKNMTTRNTEIQEATCGGGYYPLSYWDRQGFDTKLIEELCTDTRPHSIFGTVYRVKIDFVQDGNRHEKISDKVYKAIENLGGSSSSELPDPESNLVPPPTDAKSLQKQKVTAQKVLMKLGAITAPLQLTLKHKAISSTIVASINTIDIESSSPTQSSSSSSSAS